MRVAARQDSEPVVLGHVESLFRVHVDAVYNVAYRVVWSRADAEDIVQRTFVKALTRLDQVRDAGRVRPWLLQVAYREAITVTRQRRDVPTDPAALPDSPVLGCCPAEAAVAADQATVVHRALGRMAPDERLAVVLRDVEELPMGDVAEVLGVGLSAAKMRVHRGRASLRTLLSATVEVQ